MNDTFKQNITSMLGEKGKQWLEEIPQIIKTYEEKWDIRVSDPFPLSYNYVAPAKRHNGDSVVIKIGFPDNREFTSEVAALKIFNGNGVEKILQEDLDSAVVLLEQVLPGKMLYLLGDDEQEVKIACRLLKKLWQTPPENNNLQILAKMHNGFKRIREKYNGTTGPLPESLVDTAENLFNTLQEATREPVLLHGDFHHYNILSSNRDEWLAIDPKGIIGDKCYDIAIFLNNPQSELLKRQNVAEVLEKRIDIFSETLGIEKRQIKEWGITMAVLGAIWSAMDHGKGWEHGVTVAEILTSIKT